MTDMLIEIKYNREKSSNASMFYDGKCSEGVTEKDVVAKFGSGTFGHKFAKTSPTTFNYWKWTD